ncbi:MAG: DsrE family protein [Deltaproteobacteria bacterium]|nr:DsrE family protein [Deltaproteobacteria bacterium]
MKTLIVLNESPYGSERTYNGLRLAGSLAKQENSELKVFLIGDAVAGAHNGQKVPQGYYNVQVMLGAITRRGVAVGTCGTCMDARGIRDEDLVEGAQRSTMDELTTWTVWADKVIAF